MSQLLCTATHNFCDVNNIYRTVPTGTVIDTTDASLNASIAAEFTSGSAASRFTSTVPVGSVTTPVNTLPTF